MEKFENKSAKIKIPAHTLHESIKRLVPEGVIITYEESAEKVFDRSPLIHLLEMQVCKVENSLLRKVCTKKTNGFIEGSVDFIPVKTHFSRMLPVENTLTGSREIRNSSTGLPTGKQLLRVL